MRNGTPGFVRERLIEARELRCIPTRQALAGLIGKNASTIGRWEDGHSTPEPEALMELAKALNVRPEYFLRPHRTPDAGQPTFFRSLASALKRDIAMQRARMKWLQELGHTLQHYVDFPSVDIPDVLNGTNFKQLRDEDFETIALELRRYWQLGDHPISDMVDLMERVGFVVASEEMGTSKLDGLCQWSEVDDRPYVLLASDKMSFPRRQMDAAHEMAHAVLHRQVTTEQLKHDFKLIESQAFRLASAFLMPATSYPLEVRIPSLAAFEVSKERWRVSIKAQIKRMQDLDVIEEDHARYLYKLYSTKGWSREEPLDREWDLQKPRLLSEAICAIVDSGMRSKADLVNCEFAISASDVEKLASLPEGWFSRQPAEIITLKFDKSGSKEAEN